MTTPRRRSIGRTALIGCLALVASTGAGQLWSTSPVHAAAAVITDGNARFEVLTPTLIRMEYAGDGVFESRTTFNVVNRSFPVPAYSTSAGNGTLEIRTSALTLRYKQDSGPFTSDNVSVSLTATGATGNPVFPSHCAFGVACEAENALLTGRAATAYDHGGHTGSGFVAGLEATGGVEKVGNGISVDVSGVASAGTYRLAVRYANGGGTTRAVSTSVNGVAGPRLSLPGTGSWDAWSTVSAPVTLAAGTNTIAVRQLSGDDARVNLDSLAVTRSGATGYPGPATGGLALTGYGAGPASTLGGWARAMDNPRLEPGTPNITTHPGVLNRGGWYLLDDSRTALFDPGTRQVTGRPDHGRQPYQDGYLFGYGQDFKQALRDLNALTGETALLPRSAYGVWYSRYYPYSDADYRTTVVPKFQASFTPLDWLVIDTDWKSPTQWNGWNWKQSLFPDPAGFLSWTKTKGLAVSLNIHPSIAESDPRYAETNSAAGGLPLDPTAHTDIRAHIFDLSNPKHLAAYLKLHDPFEQQGVRAWWFDHCIGCDSSVVTNPNVAPDNFINQVYADDASARGVRGFAFSRIGGSEAGKNSGASPIGPWSERRNTLQFTGDTLDNWETLRYAVRFTTDEAAAGLSHVSHDIGSFHGKVLPNDFYIRWLQFGAFQPIDRLHAENSTGAGVPNGVRLPWDYPAVQEQAEKFLRLRESLVPLTYSLARQASATGVPIVRPMYLNYPGHEAAYSAGGQYLYGDDVLVAPVTSANDASGTATVSFWVPPGSWTDYFTGATYTGPSTATVQVPLDRMAVLVRSGGVLPTRTDYVHNQAESVMSKVTVNVAAGGDGSFSLYQDAGEGTGYRQGQSTTTALSWRDGDRTLTIGADVGTYPNAPTGRAYTVRLSNATAPAAVRVDGVVVPETAWGYNGNTRTVTITTKSLPVTGSHTVTLVGGAAGNPTAGATVGLGGLCLDVKGGTAANGQPVQAYTCDQTTAQQISYQPDNTLRVLGRCLTAASGDSDAAVTTQDCAGGSRQQWRRMTNGTVTNTGAGDRCLTVPSDNTGPGAVQVTVADCADRAGQRWQLPPGQITMPGGLCVDVAGADPGSTTPVRLFTCNGSDAQRWSTPGDQTVRVFDKCLDAEHGATANNTPVQLFDCNGSAAQRWLPQANGSLLHPASGRCLDDTGAGQKSGDRLQIYDCKDIPAQKFRLG